MAEFADLTQRQLYDLYAHPRDEHGKVEPQGEEPEMTDEQADAVAMTLAMTMGTPADVERVRDTIRRREEAKGRGNPVPR